MLRDNLESKSGPAPSHSMFFSSKTALSLNQMCIVFDIDDTLTSKFERGKLEGREGSYLKFVTEQCPEQIIPIKIQGTVYDHVLSPGAREAVQYLLKAGCHLAFYSHGIDVRNQQFKTELLKRALSPEDFKKYKDQVKVFSKEKHFIDGRDNQPSDLGGRTHGNQKKDLNFVIEEFAKSGIKLSLDQIILVDDDLSWMRKGQEKNFLKIPSFTEYEIYRDLDGLEKNRINHIFFAIGLINSILKSGKPLDTLLNLQFRKQGGWVDYYFELSEETEYYKAGLKALRTVNKDLQLIDPEYIQQKSSSKKPG